jgi:hypothetical protein
MKDEITDAIKLVTKEWAKQRKAEDRNSQARYRRKYIYSGRIHFTEIASEILPSAHEKASGSGAFTVSQRHMYYACRKEFQRLTGREITAEYFTNKILRTYLNRNPDCDWKITADPRGNLTIPNAKTDIRIPCGTIAIDEYLRRWVPGKLNSDIEDSRIDERWQSLSPGHRYQAVLYIEKEGFDPMLQEARIAEKYDLAIVSCKGQSVVAARKFVDMVCAVGGGLPLFTVHDLDESGFNIAQRLTSESDSAVEQGRVAYHFRNAINVVDFGLRLEDVSKYHLQSERFEPKNLHIPNATREEVEFLRGGNRVELNAFTAPEFIEWLEGKLDEHLPKRLIPDVAILEAAYRRAVTVGYVNKHIEVLIREGIELGESASFEAEHFTKRLEGLVDENTPWDLAVYSMAQEFEEGKS